MLDAFLQAFVTVLSGQNILFLSFGVGFGLVVGVLPGFGGLVGLALLLPFVYGMDPTAGLAMMTGLLPVGSTSDTFHAVLPGIPGPVSAKATIMACFTLAKRGGAARQTSSPFTSSLLVRSYCAV